LFYLFINPAYVLAKNSDSNQLNATKEQNQDDNSRIAQRKWETKYLQHRIQEPDKKSSKRDDETELRTQRQSVIGEANNSVEPDAKRSQKTVIILLSGKSGRTIEEN